MKAFETTFGAASGLTLGLVVGGLALVFLCFCACCACYAPTVMLNVDDIMKTVEAGGPER